MHSETLIPRVIGYVGSLLFTLMAFAILFFPDFFHLQMRSAILIISVLALFQFVLQSICFLKLFKEKGPRWNLVVFFSTLSIILIIIVGSIWIMDHLDYHMMVM
jgi:cytochrome o ubiquinol oxidase subunit IV